MKKTCITCKNYPPESKWPCIDCDMRNPADRWEPQELSKNSTELDKGNGELHPTCTGSYTGSEELKQEVKNSKELSETQNALDTISRQAWKMTREEAIETLHEIQRDAWPNSYTEKACEMAIKALEQEPCEDAVSREAVTDVIRHSDIFSTWYEMDDTDDIVAEVIDEARKQLVDDVNELPSVTPKCPECDDAVSREAAIDAALSAFSRGLLASPDIRKLPSVQPERKTGWWMIREGMSDVQCSECGMYFSDVYDMENSDAFCRHCGTKMEGLKVVKNG